LKSQWFETLFQGVAVEFWNLAMPPAVTLKEADFLEQALALEAGARVLDVPCGNGRHAIELARRGHRLVGIDLSAEFLDRARKNGPGIDWRHGDMRELPVGEAEFDAAYCFGNSFGYLDHENAGKFLAALAHALKPSGRIAIDTGVAAESILPALPPKRWHRTGDIFTLSEARYAAKESRLDIEYTFLRNGSIETRSAASYVFTIGDLRRMLETAGFEVTALHGGVGGEPYEMGSPRLVIVAGRSTG